MSNQLRRSTAPELDRLLRDMFGINSRLDEAGLTSAAARMSMAIDAYYEERRSAERRCRKLDGEM